jgi:hypothetical protein
MHTLIFFLRTPVCSYMITQYCDALPKSLKAGILEQHCLLDHAVTFTPQRKWSKHLHRNGTFGEGVFYSVLHVPTSGKAVRVSQRTVHGESSERKHRDR